MSEFTVTTHGLVQFRDKLRRLKTGMRRAVGEELYADLNVVMVDSQELVPYDEGDLYDSGEVDRPITSGADILVRLHYGSSTVRYALKQHEDLELNHPNGGQAKFLEQPFRAWSRNGPARVVRRAIRRAMA